MTTSHLNELRGGTHLIKVLFFYIINLFSLVESCSSLCEVFFHQIDVGFILTHVNSWILDEQDSEVVEALGNFLTLLEGFLRQGQSLAESMLG